VCAALGDRRREGATRERAVRPAAACYRYQCTITMGLTCCIESCVLYPMIHGADDMLSIDVPAATGYSLP
jgi:hypothetical protein